MFGFAARRFRFRNREGFGRRRFRFCNGEGFGMGCRMRRRYLKNHNSVFIKDKKAILKSQLDQLDAQRKYIEEQLENF